MNDIETKARKHLRKRLNQERWRWQIIGKVVDMKVYTDPDQQNVFQYHVTFDNGFPRDFEVRVYAKSYSMWEI